MVRGASLLLKVAIICVSGTPHTQAEDTSDQPKLQYDQGLKAST